MKWVLLLILAFPPLLIRADEPRYATVFTSANAKFELKFNQGEDWSLIEKSSGKEIYRLVGSIWSMSV